MAERDTITTKFKVDVSELKSGISEANKQIKLANAQFKAASAGMDDWKNSSEGLNAKLKQLGTLLDQEKSKLKNYNDQITAQQNAYKENGKRIDELKAKLQQLANQGVSKTSEEYKKYEKALNNCEKEQIANQKEIDKLTITMTNQQGKVNGLEKDIRNYNKQLQNLENQQEDVNDSTKNMSDGFTTAKATLANLVADGIRRTIDAMKELVTQTIEVGKQFDTSMSKVGAVSGATADELEQLRDKAKEMGSTTKFTASEAAEAFNYMAMAGWKTEDMLNGIDGVLSLAAASGSDLATTSDIVTDALTAMGYTAKDVGKFADVMAAASSNANTNVEMMGLTFQYAAPIAGALGYSIEDLAVGIGLMANAGIKGEKSGTALRSILTRLSAPPSECADAMKKLGIEITNADGTMKPLNEIIIDLRKGFNGLSEAEQTNIAKNIAGQEAMSGLLAIVNATETDFNKLTNAVNNSSGAAKDMADTMQDNLGGDMTKLSSQIEGIQLQLYEKFEPTLRKVIKSVSKNLSSINWDAFGKKVEKAFDKALAGFEWIIEHKSQVVGAMKLMIAAFAVAKINKWTKSMSGVVTGFLDLVKDAKKATVSVNENTTAQVGNTAAQVAGTTATKGLTVATNLLNTAWKANPIGLLVTAALALYTIYTKLKGKTNELTEAEKKSSEELKNQTDKINENKASWDSLKESQQQQLDAGMTELSYYQSLANELDSLVDSNGRVKQGYEDRASFIISTLNEALGTEISMTDGVINKYGELKQTIDEVMQKKKAEILLTAQEELYADAIKNRNSQMQLSADAYDTLKTKQQEQKKIQDELKQAEKDLEVVRKWGSNGAKIAAEQEIEAIEKKLKKKDKEVKDAQKNYKKQEDILNEYAFNISQYEKNMELAHAGHYDQMTMLDWNYMDQFKTTEDAKKAQLETDIENEQSWLERLKKQREESGSEMYDQQIKQSEETIAAKKEELKQYLATQESGLNKIEEDWAISLSDQLSTITGRKIEFRDAGNGLVQAVVDGVETGEPLAKDEMLEFGKVAVSQLKKKEITDDAETAGKNIVKGAGKGIENKDTQDSVFTKIWNFGKNLLGKFKKSLDENSPSKATNEMGQNLLKGLGIGIDKQENPILNQVKSFGESVIDTLNNELDSDIGNNLTNRLNGLKNGISNSTTGLRSNLANVIGANNNSSTTSNVNNFTQNIYAPQQPSRIELYRQTRNLLNYVKKEG